MKISRIQELLEARYLTGEAFQDRSIWSACGGELVAEILKSADKDCVLLTGLTTSEVVRLGIIAEVGCIVFVRGRRVDRGVIDAAAECRLPLLSTSLPLFVACGQLYMDGLRGFAESW
ncbi:DRTGG domain protein [Desulfococcus multivorans]|uniref:DRTGG domain protein n=1 Tax=Desulfococcus multivorans DSM 2059 TaxID=1121405 RepID=S7V3Q9_DESML|nr:DRTGG domain protein [Desulfococcus multivorans]AOY57535.1 conserved uncharacterized protein, DRTTG domain [Desulfococcus multivorans]AQU99958.1 hypothetical protein B2D07_03645 [Desulfococcus multivorans]EPR39288.1 DRTGG domain protein [Desulfococcus multivorans DSM 2059]SKA12181.1 hypothetical protein SAMN02745446_02850 [Desulfococcus multivorans DSM 2059]